MSVDFSNAYQEIMFDNLVSIIKQNFVFQTQLKLAESTGKENTELKATIQELNEGLRAAQNEIKTNETFKVKYNQNESAHEEKGRIQQALNDSMKKNASLMKQLSEKNDEIQGLKNYIDKLEGIAPTSKFKKINPELVSEKKVDEKPIETVSDLFAIKVNDGSSF